MVAKVPGMLALLALAFSTRGSGPASHLAGDGGMLRRVAEPPPHRARADPVRVRRLAELRLARGRDQDPARNLARANVIGVIVVIVLYLSLNLAYLWVLTPRGDRDVAALAADVARAGRGRGRRALRRAARSSSRASDFWRSSSSPARASITRWRGTVFFPRAGRLHPRYHTPVFALWFQAAVSLVLLTTNTYDQLLSYIVFADWLFFGLTAGALIIVRRAQPAAGRDRAVPGHP